MTAVMRVVSVMTSVVMLMLALAPLRRLKAYSLRVTVLMTMPFQRAVLYSNVRSGLLVILAFVRQQGLYPPVEAVPPKPSSLSLFNQL